MRPRDDIVPRFFACTGGKIAKTLHAVLAFEKMKFLRFVKYS